MCLITNFNHSETIDVHDIQPSITLNLSNNANDNLPRNNNVIYLADNNNDTNSQPDDNNEISNSHVVNTSIESQKSPEKDNKYKMKSPSNNYEITTSSHEINTTTKSPIHLKYLIYPVRNRLTIPMNYLVLIK